MKYLFNSIPRGVIYHSLLYDLTNIFRVMFVNLKQENLDLVINVALAEDYIYVKGTEHDTDGMVAQAIADSAFERSFK